MPFPYPTPLRRAAEDREGRRQGGYFLPFPREIGSETVFLERDKACHR
jgi:hypothetical protein